MDSSPSCSWSEVAARAATLDERLANYRNRGPVGEPAFAGAVRDWSEACGGRLEQRLASLGLSAADLPQCLAAPASGGNDEWCLLASEAAPSPDDVTCERLVEAAIGRLPHESRVGGRLADDLRASAGHALEGIEDADLTRDRPALIRFAATTALLWAERTGDLLRRIRDDADSIARKLGWADCHLVGVTPGRSDPHHGQARVVICTLESSLGERAQVVYKPRDVSAEAAWASLVARLASGSADIGRPSWVISGSDYGWVEFTPAEPAQTDHDVSIYYTRCGALAAVLYCLGAVDAITENIAAHRNFPAVIDVETMLQPRLERSRLPYTILDTMLLPRWLRVADFAVDLTALGLPNRDIVIPLTRMSDLIGPEGRVESVLDHQHEILAGFDSAWRFLQSHGARILGEIIDMWATAQVRVVPRMTGAYVMRLKRSLEPVNCTDGLRRSLSLESLARLPLTDPESPVTLALVDAERHALEQGDVPCFRVRGDDMALGGSLAMFSESAVNRARASLVTLDDVDFERQREYVRASLAVAAPDSRAITLSVAPNDAAADLDEAIAHLTNRIMWSIERVPVGRRPVGLVVASERQWGISPLDDGLADGVLGVAIALAAADQVLDEVRIRAAAVDLAVSALTATAGRADRVVRERGAAGLAGSLLGSEVICELVPESGELRAAATLLQAQPAATGLNWPPGSDFGQGAGDRLAGGVAGEVLRARLAEGRVDPRMVEGLAARALADRLRLGVPSDSPLPALGLQAGLAGVLYALVAARVSRRLPAVLI